MGRERQHAPIRSHRDGETHNHQSGGVGERGRQVLRKAPTAARKLAGQTTPADTTTIITGNF